MLRPFILPAILCLTAAHLVAQGSPSPRLVLQALDTDGDGTLSADEIQRATDSLLKLDRNHDGRLTPDEYLPRQPTAQITDSVMQPHQPERHDPLIDCMDVDHNGTLTAAELASASGALKTLDTNADGILQPAEMKIQESSPGERAAQLLTESDTNKDGVLSKRETPYDMQRQFSAIDTNHDGKLDREELTTYFATQTQSRRGSAAPRNDAPAARHLPAPADQDAKPVQPHE